MPRILRLLLGCFLLVVLAASLVVFLKAGASFFYTKFQVPGQELILQDGAYRYGFSYDARIYDPGSILIFEGQELLERVTEKEVLEQTGTYAVENSTAGHVDFSISPSQPASNQAAPPNLRVFIRPYIFSNNVGGLLLLILCTFLIFFLGGSLSNPHKRQVLLSSPFGFVKLWFNLFDPRERQAYKLSRSSTKADWIRSAIDLTLLVFLYVGLEWVFMVTRPSSMDILSIWGKIKTLLISGLVAALGFLLLLLFLYVLNLLIRPKLPSFDPVARHIPAAVITTCLCLILVDNFTYTMFSFGVVSSKLFVRLGYGLAFIAVFSYFLNRFAFTRAATAGNASRIKGTTALVLLTGSILLTAASITPQNLTGKDDEVSGSRKPHVIILGSDGLNAKNLSVYGYERDTTPFLRELAKTSLLSENHFTNSGHSMGSDTALLTGKLPLTTRTLFPPDSLRGEDMYQHLPGILLRSGYRTIQLGVPYYVDANVTNFQDAFAEINCGRNPTSRLENRFLSLGFDNEVQFFSSVASRISDRLGHIFFLKNMENPYTQVTHPVSNELLDSERINCLRAYVKQASESGQPLFAHVHLMSTHGAKFYPSVQVFSRGKEQLDDWMTDFYDDTILGFDQVVQELVNLLKDLGEYDNTILVIYTDHGQRYVSDQRLPLIIHFPGDQFSAVIKENTQTIDVAPTILDFLGSQKPYWMEGESLLQDLDPTRIILGTTTNKAELVDGMFLLTPRTVKPPFYQFSQLTAVQCQNLHRIDLVTLSIQSMQVEGYTHPCPPESLDDQAGIWDKVGKILTASGYELPSEWK